MALMKLVDGHLVEMSPEDIRQREVDEREFARQMPPDRVPAWAAKAILHEDGLLAAAEAAANGAGGAWPFRFAGAATWARADALMLGVGAMGLTEQQVDEMLTRAAALAAE